MTKPSAITDATSAADNDSATKSFARSVLISSVSFLTLVSAVGATLTVAGTATAEGASTSTSVNSALVSKTHTLKALKTLKAQGKRHHPPRPTTPAPAPTTPAPAPTTPAPAPTTPAPAPTTPAPVPTTPAPAPTTPAPAPTSPSSGGSAPSSPHAGTPAGITLTTMGAMTITKPGTVIDAANITGSVVINADNVVIRRSRVSGTGAVGVYVKSGSLTLEDTTVSGFDDLVGGDNYTATRVEVTKALDDGFKIGSNVTIQDSWCHDMTIEPGAHSDCGQIQSGIKNVIIRRNWFDQGDSDGNAALFIAPDLGPSSAGPLLVENNVLGGGNFSIQCVDGNNGEYFIDAVTIRGNKFLRNGRYGALRVNVPATVTNNSYLDDGEAVTSS